MYILKLTFLYLIVAFFPAMLLYLTLSGLIQVIALCALLLSILIALSFSDKLVLAFLGAREIIDSDNIKFFQLLKTETYKEVEEMPKVYVYTGHRKKLFVLNLRSSWSIVMDRDLISSLDQDQARSLIRYAIKTKKKKSTSLQVVGMGISSIILKAVYWFAQKLTFNAQKKKIKAFVFISFIMLKPLIEAILKITISREKIFCEEELKPVYLNMDLSILNRNFMDFMLLHLETGVSLKGCIIEYLEGFPLIENCKFRGSV